MSPLDSYLHAYPVAPASVHGADDGAGTTNARHGMAALSEQQRAVLRRLPSGATDKEIARELGLAEGTVKAHVKGILRKLGVRNRTQAAVVTALADAALAATVTGG